MNKPYQPIEDFDKLFKEYYPAAVLFAQKFVQDVNGARDVAQQVFVKIYEKREKIDIETSFKAYLFRAIRNTALTYIKKQQTHSRHTTEASNLQPISTIDPDPVEYQQLVQQIDALIGDLPPRCQQVFKMNRFDGKKNKAIAEELGISIRTVETQISYALKQLRAKLPKELLLFFILQQFIF